MTQSAKGIKSDAITTVIADTISDINTTIGNVASDVTTLTTTVSNVASNVSTLTSAVDNVVSNVSTLTTSVNTVTSDISNVQSTVTTIATPKISSIAYSGDDTAADPAGGQTITLNGLNFVTGATVLINNQPVSVVSVVNSTTITFTSPALAAGSYIVYVINTDGGTGISIPGIQYSGTPAWTTPAGTLGSQYETTSVNKTLVSAGDAPIAYSLVSGSLPPGATLNANGTLTGTSQLTSSSTTYTFTVAASDAQNQDTNRQFSITINPDVLTWSAPANASVITSYEYSNISNVSLSATSAIGDGVSYSASGLPTGISLSGSTISGMSNTVANTTATITATGNTTTRTSSETVYFNVQQDVVTWSEPTANATITLDGAVYSNALSATSAAGKSVSYSANALPTGLSLTGNTISGTPTTAGNVTTLLTATAATTNRSATNTITWVINLGDSYWKNVSLLLTGSTPTTSFINDASLNNSQLTVTGDTKPNKFSPYSSGYYSVLFNGTVNDYLSIPHNSNLSIMSGSTNTFVAECWVNFTSVNANCVIMDKSGRNSVSFDNWSISLDPSKNFRIVWGISGSPGSSSVGSLTSSIIPVAGVWYHVALVKSSADWSLFINGTRAVTVNGYNTANDGNPGALRIGLGIGGEYNGAYVAGYISNVRIYNGTSGSAPYSATSTTITVPTAPLTSNANIYALTNQSNRYLDTSSTNATITAGSGVKISSVVPFATNSSYASYGSAYFDGTGDYLSVPNSAAFNLPGDFTMEAWVYPTSYPGSNNTVMSMWTAGLSFIFKVVSGNRISFYGYPGSTIGVVASSTTVDLNKWSHVAATRVGSTVRLYVNGVQDAASVTMAGTLAGTTDTLNVGSLGTIELWNGYITDARIVKGTAIYTTTFTPPTQPLTSVSGTSLLTCQYNGGANNKGFVDQSSFNNIITRNGNATQGTFSPFSQNGWSNYFNGSTDYLQLANNTALDQNGPFTFECWVFPTSLSGADKYMFSELVSGYLCFAITSAGKFIVDKSYVGAQITSTDTYTAGSWYHYAVSCDGTTTKLFVNGTLQGSANTTGVASGAVGTIGFYNNNYFSGYLSNMRWVKGTALYSTAFTPSTTPLTAITKTAVLTCQSNRFVDNSTNNLPITIYGSPSVQAFSPFGGVTSVPTSYSMYFDGTGDNITVGSAVIPLPTTTTPFTMEAWVYVTAFTGISIMATNFASGGIPFHLGLNNGTQSTTTAGGYLHMSYYTGSAWTFAAQSTSSNSTQLSLNTWYHVAGVYSGTTAKLFVNGVNTVTNSVSTWQTTASSAGGINIGRKWDTSTSAYFSGYISNARLVIGTAVYTADFTPSTTPLTAITNTTLLTCQSATMIDNSTNNFAITAFGDAKPKSFNPFGDTTTKNVSYTPAVNSGSMYFDGTDDRLTIANYPALAFGTDDFTIQCWFYTNVTSTEQTIMTNGWSSYAPWLIRLNASNQIVLNMSFNGSGWYISEAVFGTVVPKQWYHVAVTKSGANGSIRAFLNGVQGYTADVTTSKLYDGSQALTIGGRDDTSVPFNGYITDAQLIKGTALYSAAFVPPVSPATLTNQTTLLLNGTSGGIIDYHSGSDLETVGNAQLASEDPYAGTYYSNYFDGSGDYITLPVSANLAFDGNFTVECWVYLNSVSGLQGVYSSIDNSGDTWAGVYLGFSGTSFLATSYISSADVITHQTTVVAGQWYHIAIVRNGSSTKSYLNGVQSTGTTSGTYSLTQSGGTIGSAYPGTSPLNGYISNLRVVKGTAVYTSGFTPSTAPLTSISGTQLLTCQTNSFKDNSTNNLTLTRNGDTKVKSINPFQQNTGKSLYFNGTSNALLFPGSSVPSGAGSAFTVEFWYYPTTLSSVILRANGNGSSLGLSTSSTGQVVVSNNFASDFLTTSGVVVIGSWNHVALTRTSANLYTVYLNGTSVGSATYSTSLGEQPQIYIGYNTYNSSYYTYYIKDLRITKGIARYTSTFTPPTTPLVSK